MNATDCWGLKNARVQFGKRIEVNLDERRPDWACLSEPQIGGASDSKAKTLPVRCHLMIKDVRVSLDFSVQVQPGEAEISALQLMCDLEESKQGVQSSVQIVYQ